ncbi:MAG: DUF438 domain-containing protein [Phycisphaerales bacterium]|nr:DUF438 domain-containing protein [Phycisphaerales bacterium]
MSELLQNSNHRIKVLKSIIKDLHAGQSPEATKAKLRELVKHCDAAEIAQVEQELIDDGVPVTEIMAMCDLRTHVITNILPNPPNPQPIQNNNPLQPGHPLSTFKEENAAIDRQLELLGKSLAKLAQTQPNGSLTPPNTLLIETRTLLNELMDIENHYQRKEHLLFSMFERHGITGPSTVMWAKDDQACELLKQLHQAVMQEGVTTAEWRTIIPVIARPAFVAITEMVFKEEHVIFPMALKTLTETQWGEIWTQSPQFGWCLTDPKTGYTPPTSQTLQQPSDHTDGQDPSSISLNLVPPSAGRAGPLPGAIMFPTGALTLQQLISIFSNLPVDLTFVDADDRVRFFSEGPDRVFIRPKAVIGRKVQHCHPPGSVHIVDEIIKDFRSGKQSVADFWIEFQGRFVLIRYFALRDDNNTYLGTLEVTQDITRERALTGQRRLLQYDDPQPV